MEFLPVGNKSEASIEHEDAINGDSEKICKGLNDKADYWMKLMEGSNPALKLSLSACSGEENYSSKNMLCRKSGFRSAIPMLKQSHLECVYPPLSRPDRSPVPEKQPRVSAQLTIFYGGRVNVYDDIPADKAQAIMLLAGNGNHGSFGSLSPPEKSVSLAVFSQPTRKVSDLPIARKQSLQRFLEKRQDRRQSKSPYATEENAKTKPSPSPSPISSSPTLQAN